ncbi:MAG: hypothetical protein R2748_08185 [Bryobacterales bacterium]
MRYEIWTPRVERSDLQANFLPGPAKLIFPNDNIPTSFASDVVTNIPDGVGQRTLVRSDLNNFSRASASPTNFRTRPSCAAAAACSTCLRPSPAWAPTLPGNPPFLLSSAFPTDQVTPNVTFAGGFPSDALTATNINPRTVAIRAFQTNFDQGYVSKWSLGLQHQLAGWLFEANYVGTKGTHLPGCSTT